MKAAFPGLRVPVYLAIGDNASIEHTGVSSADAARFLLEVIARHNETVVAPKLYFAGFSPVELATQDQFMPNVGVNSLGAFSKGITVFSFPCGLLAEEGEVHPSFLCNANTKARHGCGYHHENDNFEFVGAVLLVPPSCDEAVSSTVSWSTDGSTPYDLAHTFLHELGHILGLRHTNLEAATCINQSGVPGNDPAGNTGVMRTTNSAHLALYRHWRRDDLDAFDHLWAADYPAYELAHWPDSNFPSAPVLTDPSSLAGVELIRSAAFADALVGGPQPVVLVDDTRRVLLASLAADGSVIEAPSPVDPSPLGETVGSPSVVAGSDGSDERVFVVWTADEQPTSETMSARWGLRDLSGGAWELSEGFSLRTSRVTAGFDLASASWLVASATLDGEVAISVIDFDGALLLEQQPLDVASFDLSDPVCRAGVAAGCTISYSTTALGGPKLGRVDFTVGVDPPGVFAEEVSVFAGQDVYGRLALASGGGLGTMRGVGGWFRFELGTNPGAKPSPPMPGASTLRDWPVGLGGNDGDYRLGYPVAVACGDGVVQDHEECDDGNLTPGDGCDGLCMVEVASSDTGETGETGETGGASMARGEGCECSVERDGRARPWWTLALALSLSLSFVGVGTRRRRER